MAKATHNGECQLCGKIQKLPSGVLSNHGYTVKWNMFEGICPGSRKLPYELSCELIKSQVPVIQERLKNLGQKRIQLLSSSTEPKAWVHVYLKSINKYLWKEVELTKESRECNSHQWKVVIMCFSDEGKEIREEINKAGVDSSLPILDIATNLNHKYVLSCLDSRIKQMQDYLVWCERRISEWQLAELKIIAG